MKKSITLIICLWSAIITQAQQDSSFFEVGINAFRLVDRVSGGSDRSNINPYLFTAEYSFGKIGIRTGLDINNMSRKDLPAPVNGNTTLTADSSYSNMRFGLVYYKNLTSRWSMKTGIDYIMATQKSSVETSFPDPNQVDVVNLLEATRKESGISPFFYVQYHLSPRVSLGTELLCNITSWKRTETSSNSQFPITDTKREQEGSSFVFMAPSALFLSVRF